MKSTQRASSCGFENIIGPSLRLRGPHPEGDPMRARVGPKTTVCFQLPIDLLERVRSVARRRDSSVSAAMRAGLRLWLATQDDAGERQ